MASLQAPMHSKATRARARKRDLRDDLDVLGAAAALYPSGPWWHWSLADASRRFGTFENSKAVANWLISRGLKAHSSPAT